MLRVWNLKGLKYENENTMQNINAIAQDTRPDVNF